MFVFLRFSNIKALTTGEHSKLNLEGPDKLGSNSNWLQFLQQGVQTLILEHPKELNFCPPGPLQGESSVLRTDRNRKQTGRSVFLFLPSHRVRHGTPKEPDG